MKTDAMSAEYSRTRPQRPPSTFAAAMAPSQSVACGAADSIRKARALVVSSAARDANEVGGAKVLGLCVVAVVAEDLADLLARALLRLRADGPAEAVAPVGHHDLQRLAVDEEPGHVRERLEDERHVDGDGALELDEEARVALRGRPVGPRGRPEERHVVAERRDRLVARRAGRRRQAYALAVDEVVREGREDVRQQRAPDAALLEDEAARPQGRRAAPLGVVRGLGQVQDPLPLRVAAARRLLHLLVLAEVVGRLPVGVPRDEAHGHAPARPAGADHLLAHADGHPDAPDRHALVAAALAAAAPVQPPEQEAPDPEVPGDEQHQRRAARRPALAARLRRHGRRCVGSPFRSICACGDWAGDASTRHLRQETDRFDPQGLSRATTTRV